MASKIISLLALGSLGTVAAVQPAGSQAIAMAGEAQASMLQVQMQDKLSELATNQLMEELGLQADFGKALKDAMTGFSKELLTAVKPTVTDVCTDIVSQVAAYQQSVDEEQLDADLGFVETSNTRLTDIVPHNAQRGLSMVEQQFWDSAKKALQKVASGVKQAASPIVAKIKDGVKKAMLQVLQKVKPMLQQRLAEMISTVCEKAKDTIENVAN